jgi:phenylalanyl-tRNA synthetase alpha subunit
LGKFSNDIKVEILDAFEKQISLLKNLEIQQKLTNEFEDITIPVNNNYSTHIHPITKVLKELEDTFKRM